MPSGFFNTVFSGPPEQQYYSTAARRSLNSLLEPTRFKGQVAQMDQNVKEYGKGLDQALADYARLKPTSEADLTGMIGNLTRFDPMTTYERMRMGDTNSWRDMANSISGGITRGDKLAQIAMGGGGRPATSYDKRLFAIGSAPYLTNAWTNVMNNLGRNTEMVGNQLRGSLGDAAKLVQDRLGIPMVGTDIPLMKNAAIGDGGIYDMLGKNIGLSRENTSGYLSKPGLVDYWDRSMDSIAKTANTAASVYGAIGGMGGLGGMGGGGGGGLGGMLGGLMGGGGGGGVGGASKPLYGWTPQAMVQPTPQYVPQAGNGSIQSVIQAILGAMQSGGNNPFGAYGGGVYGGVNTPPPGTISMPDASYAPWSFPQYLG